MSTTLILSLTILLIMLASTVALRLKPKNPKDAVMAVSGYLTAFFLVLAFAIYAAPKVILNSERQVGNNWEPVGVRLQSLWSQVVGEGETTLPPVPTAAPPAVAVVDSSDQGTAPETSAQTVIPAATLSPTQTLKLQLYTQLDQAKQAGDRATGKATANLILETFPGDVTATTALTEIASAEQVAAEYYDLTFYGKAQGGDVSTILRGYTYQIVSIQAGTWTSVWDETTTLQIVTPGWMYGFQFLVLRGHVRTYADQVGVTFTWR